MKSRTVDDLLNIARLGAGLRVDAAPRTAGDLMSIVRVAAKKGGTVTISGTRKFRADDLLNIARIGKNHVILED